MGKKNSTRKECYPRCPLCGKPIKDTTLGENSYGTYLCHECQNVFYVKTDCNGEVLKSGKI